MTGKRWAGGGLVVLALMCSCAAAVAAPRATATKWIVFSGDANGAGLQQLFRISTAGAEIRQITTGSLPALAPSFSPAGTRIAFTRLGSGIFTMNVDGSGLRRLTSNGRDSYPVWSPDGTRIAFIRLFQNSWRIFTMSPTGKDQRRLPQAPVAGRPSWTPDGKSIFIPTTGDLVRIDSSTGKVQKYLGVPLDIQTGQTATVSPNGRLTAFVNPRRSTGPPDCGEGRCQQFGLYLANVPAPHRVRKLVDDAGPAGWSPDSKTIVYAAKGVLTFRTVATGALRTIDTGTHVVIPDSGPAWQPR